MARQRFSNCAQLSFCKFIQKQPLEVFCEKRCLGNLTKFTGKYLCQSLFINKIAPELKKRLRNRRFSVNFVKFSRTPFLQNTSGRLLLFILSWFSIRRNPLYYKVFGSKHISVGDAQKHLSSANPKIKHNEKITYKNISLWTTQSI